MRFVSGAEPPSVLGAKAINAGDLPTARGLGLIGIDSGIQAEWFFRLRGMSYGMNLVRRIDDGLGSLVFVPKSATLDGWDNIAFDGNQNNTTSSTQVIEFEATNKSSGKGFSLLGDKASQEEYSYKMASC